MCNSLENSCHRRILIVEHFNRRVNRVCDEYGRRSSSSRRLFLQAAEVIFKGTADLFRSRHFISLYRLTSGLLTVEKKQQEREREREAGREGQRERDDKKKKSRPPRLAGKRRRFFRKNSLPSRGISKDVLSAPRSLVGSRRLPLFLVFWTAGKYGRRRFNDCRVIEVFQVR